jgi:hypothetical protein
MSSGAIDFFMAEFFRGCAAEDADRVRRAVAWLEALRGPATVNGIPKQLLPLIRIASQARKASREAAA